VLLALPSEAHLLDAVDMAEAAGIRCILIYESDDGMGYTAACTIPVTNGCRRVFRRFPLWSTPLSIT
jgi:hypothetical protein